ncbi:hypothetical protein H634G_02782 [Metarhizium anisopliae BRIP 53293]|uniref:Uncharacterized protein n=1 Tax=Metarhizium anisopliae BRIP 53293 TaxID=1291518 RepID=A0A0D9P5W8_METAN|nr:hypothetical protein H634G_02782 [Metarhizium anisopliae BRIP 53293]KJK86392.1 hypothetical protein H633G_09779 [Metarhizium anisopliae BRIP 53284]
MVLGHDGAIAIATPFNYSCAEWSEIDGGLIPVRQFRMVKFCWTHIKTYRMLKLLRMLLISGIVSLGG